MSIHDKFLLTGRVAIVTGGAGFYGRPICVALAEAGAMVVVASRDIERSSAFTRHLQSRRLAAEAMKLDLAHEESIVETIEKIDEKFGRIDILVNNAVSREGFKDIELLTKEEWEKSQTINSTGLMLITRAVLKHMVEQKKGSIINIGSIQGVVGPNFPVYGDTGMTSPLIYTFDKWGMVGLTKWIANKYGKYNIRSNCISPGGYGPGVKLTVGENEFYRNYERMTPLGRFAEEDDIKGPVVFLASDASSYVTGHNLLVDGGWTSW